MIVPSVYDALGARLAERAGFPALFMSGFSVSAARLAAPGPVVGRDEALARICAAVDARGRGADILLVARTDARLAPEGGMEEALQRGRAFAALGADIVFHTGAQSEAEHAAFARNVVQPQILQVDEPGRPRLTSAQAHGLGFRIALFGVTQVLVAAKALADALASQARGEHPPEATQAAWSAMADIVGAPQYVEDERRLSGRQ